MADGRRGDGGEERNIVASRNKGKGKHCGSSEGVGPVSPCGACKFLRRKCISGCVFAPHFGSDQGTAKFAAVHKVFGASNVSKLLLHIPMNRRDDAVVTISYEAQARLSDPVYGCVSTILALQRQVASLQAELAMVQTQLMNNRLVMANAVAIDHQSSQQPIIGISFQQQPAFSNMSSASNNNLVNSMLTNATNFNSCSSSSLNLIKNINAECSTTNTAVGGGCYCCSSVNNMQNLEQQPPIPKMFSHLPKQDQTEQEEDSLTPIPLSFTH